MFFFKKKHRHIPDDELKNLIGNPPLQNAETSGSGSSSKGKGKDRSGDATTGESESLMNGYQQQQQLENDNQTFPDHNLAHGKANAEQAEGSAGSAYGPAMAPIATVCCEACGDAKNVKDVRRVACSHNYCGDCLQHLVEASITDDSLFPPHCCRLPIPLAAFEAFITPELTQAFINKEIEHNTPNKTYCSVPTCSAFIRSENITNTIGTCGKCGSKTCSMCKAPYHGRGECPIDPALQQVLDMVKDKGWKQCYRCSTAVERNYGCNHITCRCKAHFCYICGLVWKTCRCEEWEDTYLYEHAEVIVAREPGLRGLLHEKKLDLIERTAELLRVDHGCLHREWRYRDGPMFCERCGVVIKTPVMTCTTCYLIACRRCKNHRV